MSDDAAPGTDTDTPAAQAPKNVVAAIRGYMKRQGAPAKAVLQPVGAAGVRITLVAGDYVLGDRVVKDSATAEAVVAAIPELESSEWTRDLVANVKVPEGHYKKMAGWVQN